MFFGDVARLDWWCVLYCDEVGKDVTGPGACRCGEVMACWKIIGLTRELLFSSLLVLGTF